MPLSITAIDNCRFLYLAGISEPEDNILRLLISEAKAQEMRAEAESGPASRIEPIVSDETCRAFEVVWPSYVAYSVRNESYCVADPYERFTRTRFVLYERSRYLDFISVAAVDLSHIVGTYRHWGIFCLNHIVDVVSTQDPAITIISKTR